MTSKIQSDYIQYLANQRIHFYNECRYDIVEKINKQIKDAEFLMRTL